MSAVLVWAMLFPLAAGLSAWFRCRIEESLPLALLVWVCAGYLFALTGLLPLMGVTVWGLALAGGGWAAYVFCIKRSQPPDLLWQGTFLFLLLAALYWWLCRGCAFSDWDDFSHWGKAIKWMYTTDCLYTAPASTDGFKSYPPATALLQYIVLKAGHFGFREDLVLYANALLTASLLVLPFRSVRFARRPFGAFWMFLLLGLLPLLVVPSYFYRAGVDGLLGIFTGALLVSSFLPRRSAATPWFETLGVFVLALVKSSGTGLAALTALAMLVARLRRGESRFAWLPLASALAAGYSWSAHLSLMAVDARWKSEDSFLPALLALLFGKAPAYRYEVLRSFSLTIFQQGNYGGQHQFPFILLPLAFIGVAGAAWLTLRGKRQKASGSVFPVLPLAGTTLAVTAVFVLCLLHTYLFLFDPTEAGQLASVYRYLDTAALLMLYAGTVLLCVAVIQREPIHQAIPVLLLFLWGGLFPMEYLPDTVLYAPIHAAQTQNERYLARYAAQRIRALGEENLNLQLITANDAGAAAMRIEFELLPWRLPEQHTILMADNEKAAPWVYQISAPAWSRELAERFEYVYIYCPEDQFVRDYLSLFEDESQVVVDRMFRVVIQEDGSAKLRCLDR